MAGAALDHDRVAGGQLDFLAVADEDVAALEDVEELVALAMNVRRRAAGGIAALLEELERPVDSAPDTSIVHPGRPRSTGRSARMRASSVMSCHLRSGAS